MSNPNIDYTKLTQYQSQPTISIKKFLIVCAIFLLLAFFMLFNPFASDEPQYVLPPPYDTENQTFYKVMAFIKSDDTNTIPYGEGFNCVDSVFMVWLNARWQGILAYPVKIIYEEPPHHMVIGFYTVDEGDTFVETLDDQEIRLEVGRSYNGRKVIGIYYLDIYREWIPMYDSPEYETSMEVK